MASKKSNHSVKRFNSLADVMEASGFPPPKHPLIVLLNGVDKSLTGRAPNKSHVLNYYKIAFKPDAGGELMYGQTKFDFKEGGLFFVAPQQILSSIEEKDKEETAETKNTQSADHIAYRSRFFTAISIGTKDPSVPLFFICCQ